MLDLAVLCVFVSCTVVHATIRAWASDESGASIGEFRRMRYCSLISTHGRGGVPFFGGGARQAAGRATNKPAGAGVGYHRGAGVWGVGPGTRDLRAFSIYIYIYIYIKLY